MKVIVKMPRRSATTRDMKDLALKSLQEIVGGYIEVVPFHDEPWPSLIMIVNEEGKNIGLEPNFRRTSGMSEDVVVGPVIVVRRTADGEFAGLEKSQIPRIREYLNKRTM